MKNNELMGILKNVKINNAQKNWLIIVGSLAAVSFFANIMIYDKCSKKINTQINDNKLLQMFSTELQSKLNNSEKIVSEQHEKIEQLEIKVQNLNKIIVAQNNELKNSNGNNI